MSTRSVSSFYQAENILTNFYVKFGNVQHFLHIILKKKKMKTMNLFIDIIQIIEVHLLLLYFIF